MMHDLNRLLPVALIALSACAVGPDYVRPDVVTPVAYKESGIWQQATPQDAIDRGAWWSVYNDPILDALERRIDISNQNLKSYEASYRASLALVDQDTAGLFPTLTLNPSASESGSLKTNKPVTTYNLSASASWSIDLWGKIRRGIESDEANAASSAADVANARLSAQGTLATYYFNLRAQDEFKHILDASAEADQKALDITQHQYDAGIASPADKLSAEAQLDSTKALAIDADLKRTQYEHAIAVLVGSAPADFTLIAEKTFVYRIPNIPQELPSTLLQRRPDIAAAERLVAAANAAIGVKIAAYYPDLTLSGMFGYSSVVFGQLLNSGGNVWSVGPTLAETLFDAGARGAAVDQARANYDKTVADYRQTVLTAFQNVEDNLAALRILNDEIKVSDAAVVAARRSETINLNQYKEGIVAYNNVLTAQIARLSDEQSALTVRLNQLNASVALIQGLGGGWDSAALNKP